MKILIVNASDIIGGAARAAYRLHKALLSIGVDSQMLVQKKTSDDYTVISETTYLKNIFNKHRSLVDALPVRLYKNRTETLFSPSWLGFNNIVKKINSINPYIVHLHWVADGFLRIEDIPKIKAPIFWSFHDMWPFTGGCHYDEACGLYINSCGRCKVLQSNKENDLSHRVWQRKMSSFRKKDITIIGLSKWLNDCSKNSSLFKEKRHINLPNPIDTTLFKPIDRRLSRELWNLPKDKKLILFGAIDATSDPRKGFKEISQALHLIKNKNSEMVVFGSSAPQEPQNYGFPSHYLGCLHDDVSLVALYNAVDVMVVPSLQENLSNAIMEGLSCGTPVVAFDIGGNSDMIEHKSNGYLAKPYDSEDLARGIDWVLKSPNYKTLCENAREKVVREFESTLVARRYVELYEKVLAGKL